MKRIITLLLFVIAMYSADAQTMYFPPATGTAWDTVAPSSLGWCQPNIDSLYSFLQRKNTSSFIVLKDGKIVLEKYFGSFTADSLHLWNSASKSLAATLSGIAQEKGLIDIHHSVTSYLGQGWTSATPAEEDSITLLNLLTMTSGLNPLPAGCANTDTSVACLTYLVPAGTQWTYHTGAYRKIQNVISTASGLTMNVVTRNYIGTTIGMTGVWIQQEYASNTRSAARFGLLTLNKDVWAADTLLHDTAYYRAMTNTSQPYNLSYGYLWWLNGKASYMTPGPQIVTPGTLIPNGPTDMLCALGKNDQKIYVIPSTGMVVVRLGNAADSSTDANSNFDNELWGYIDSLGCTPSGITTVDEDHLTIYPNPSQSTIYIHTQRAFSKISIYDMLGSLISERPFATQIDVSSLPSAVYVLRLTDTDGHIVTTRMTKE